MADISKISINNTEYNIKDEASRDEIKDIRDLMPYETETAEEEQTYEFKFDTPNGRNTIEIDYTLGLILGNTYVATIRSFDANNNLLENETVDAVCEVGSTFYGDCYAVDFSLPSDDAVGVSYYDNDAWCLGPFGTSTARVEISLSGVFNVEKRTYKSIPTMVNETISKGALKATASGEVIRVDDVSPVEHTVKAKVSGKNLFNDPATVTLTSAGKNILNTAIKNQTTTGLKFTVDNGIITVDGTATATTYAKIGTIDFKAGKTYILSGCPDGGSVSTYRLDLRTETSALYEPNVFDYGSSVTFSPEENVTLQIGLRYFAGAELSNVTFKPMVQLLSDSTSTDFEPYKGVTYALEADGAVDILSVSPTMTLLTDTAGANIDIEYDQNINTAMNNVKKSIEFDYAKYGMTVLYLDGDISSMDKDNAVDLQYRFRDISGTASVKWQGSSSLNYPKKNYTVKFDQAFEPVAGWGVHNKYCMKANWIDFSHARNVVSAKLWGKVCHAHRTNERADPLTVNLPNAGAIDGFPIVIVINGEYMGLYSFCIPKDAWMFGLDETNVNHCIIGAGGGVTQTAFKAMPYIDDVNFEWEHISDNATDEDKARIETSLQNLYTELNAVSSKEELYALSNITNMEFFVQYYVYVALFSAYDCINKNYLLVTTDGTKFQISAYDLDSTFGIRPDASAFFNVDYRSYSGLANENMLFRKIYDYAKDRLKAWHNQFITWTVGNRHVSQAFYDYCKRIPKVYLDEEVKLWPGLKATNVSNLDQIINYYRLRLEFLQPEVNGWG